MIEQNIELLILDKCFIFILDKLISYIDQMLKISLD